MTSGRTKSLVLASVAVGLGIVAVEVGLRLGYPLADPFANQRRIEIGAYVPYRHEPSFRLEVVPELGLPGIEGARVFETNIDGFIGPALSETATTSRVFLVGGSTMECVALGNAENPGTLLQSDLRTRGTSASVINTGHSGDATFDHISILVHRIIHASPRIVVFLVGVNDLVATARGERYDHAQPDQQVDLGWGAMARLSLTRSYVGRLVWAAVGGARLRTWDETSPSLRTHYREAAERCRTQPPAERGPSVDLPGFERNLRALVAVTHARGAVPVLVTQPHSWNATDAEAWWWMNCIGGRRHDPGQMAAALDHLNGVTREVAAATGAQLVDLAAELSGPQHMYDDVHFNVAGARRLAELLSESIAPLLSAPKQ